MLSMASNVDNIFLLREAVHFGKINTNKLLLLNIDKLKLHLYENMINKIGINEITKKMIIDDYIVLCFLIGNDFLPHLCGLSIKNNAIENLVKNYINLVIKRKECLINNSEINLGFLKNLLKNLQKIENDLVSKERINYEKKKFNNRNNLKGLDLELTKIKFKPLLLNKTLVYKINAGTENWRDRYYYHHFNIRKNYRYIDNNLLEICQNYLEGIIWNSKYYFDKCICWNWNYSYLHAPLLKDLVENFEICIDKINFNENIQNTSTKPFIQLLNVLPPQSAHLLPKSYANLMTSKESPIYHFYPTKISLDYYMNNYFHECEPKLPNIDINLILNSTKNIVLNELEIELNKISI